MKSVRNLAVFSRFERYWLELRGATVVMFVDDNVYGGADLMRGQSGAKDSVISGIFSVEKCQVVRTRNSRSGVLKLIKYGHSQHIWLKFDDESECDVWEKALCVAAGRRVVGISDFEFISPIGKGASGKVFLVTDRKTGEKLALKVIDKAKVFESRSGFRHALDERLALELVDGHPFFTRLRYAFQTRAYFYLAIDFYDGGDLYQYLRTHQGRLRESQVRSVAAEVALALEHFHNLGFVYRDLKPENVLLDSKGHVRLADFGLCKLLPTNALTNTICGTHTYAAPEMLAVRNYGRSIDFWAFGVFVYHVLRGRTPYEARDLDQVIANMNNRRIRFSSATSPELVSMIKKLLDWNPETRLGCGDTGMTEVRGHSFFKGMDWRRVYLRENEEGGLFSVSARKLNSQTHSAQSGTHTQVPRNGNTTASGAAAHATNGMEGTRLAQVLLEEKSDREKLRKTAGLKMSGEVIVEIAPLNVGAGEVSAQGSNGAVGTNVATEVSDETVESSAKSRTQRSRRMTRPKSTGHLGITRFSMGGKERKFMRVLSDRDQHKGVTLREQMAAAAEQDDLRNFDMSEWGKVSVDNDHDDVNYGDCSLWPISKARRRLVEEERMIAGFSYCSSSTPFNLPDNL